MDEPASSHGWVEDGSLEHADGWLLWSAGALDADELGLESAAEPAGVPGSEPEVPVSDEAGCSEATSAAERSLVGLAVPVGAAADEAGVATGGGVPEAAAEGGCVLEEGALGDDAGIGGDGGATSMTTGALANAFASAMADFERCGLGAGSP